MREVRPSSPTQVGIATAETQPAAPPVLDTAAEPPSQGGPDPLANFGALHGFHPGVALLAHEGVHSSAPVTSQTVHDVAKITPAQIRAMKDSGDPATRKIGITIENAKAAYADLLPKPDGKLDPSKPAAKILVITSAGNGGEPVMVLTGPKFDTNKPARVITFYHGDNATVADPIGSKAGLNTRIRGAIDEQPQTVFVLPEANRQDGKLWHAGTDSPQARDKNDYFADWGHVRSQARTTDDALAARGITRIGSETVAVHSRGGSAITTLMGRDPSGNGLRATSLELYDSLYGSQTQVAQWARTRNGKAVKAVIYFNGNLGAAVGAPIAAAFKDRYWMVDVKGKLQGVPENKPYRDENNQTVERVYKKEKNGVKHYRKDVVRDWYEDPHYKTTGVFLGRNPGLNLI